MKLDPLADLASFDRAAVDHATRAVLAGWLRRYLFVVIAIAVLFVVVTVAPSKSPTANRSCGVSVTSERCAP